MSSPRFAPREIDIVEWLANNIKNYDMDLIIRVHPQNAEGNMADLSWLPRIKSLINIENVHVDIPKVNDSKLLWSMQKSDMTNLSKLICNSYIVINSGSTIAIDALSFKKPVIFTFFDADEKRDFYNSARRLKAYHHIAKLTSYKATLEAYSFDQLDKKIKFIINNKNDLNENIENVFKKYCFSYDGKSTDRVVNVLNNLLHLH